MKASSSYNGRYINEIKNTVNTDGWMMTDGYRISLTGFWSVELKNYHLPILSPNTENALELLQQTMENSFGAQ